MRLRFETQGERLVAAALTARWIDEILAETERGIKALGVTIDKVEMGPPRLSIRPNCIILFRIHTLLNTQLTLQHLVR